jgi:hypothetical protein
VGTRTGRLSKRSPAAAVAPKGQCRKAHRTVAPQWFSREPVSQDGSGHVRSLSAQAPETRRRRKDDLTACQFRKSNASLLHRLASS